MIKKYDQFIKEDFSLNGEESIENNIVDETPVDETPELETEDDTLEDETPEEGGKYFGAVLMDRLRDELHGEVPKTLESVSDEKIDPNTFIYKGKEVTFASETESFLVDGKEVKVNGKPIRTVEEIKDYLNKGEKPSKDVDTLDPEFESKSYKMTRKNRK